MKYFLVLFISICLFQNGFSQESQPWKGYFSYNDIKDRKGQFREGSFIKESDLEK